MQIKKISYTESIKKPMQKFESRLISISADMELTDGESEVAAVEQLKKFVRSELAKND